MNSTVLYFVSIIVHLSPETRFFAFKRFLYRMAGVKIARGVRICSSSKILGSGELSIGENAWIGHRVLIVTSSKIQIGRDVDIAPNVYIGTGTHKIDPNGKRSAGEGVNADVIIEDGAWICVNSTILPGVTIGEKCVIAAGSVVQCSTESQFVYAGIPARKIKEIID